MSELVRFGTTMERALLARFDRLVKRRGYANRSAALRDLVRRELARDSWARGDETFATITLVYDHHAGELSERLTRIQHEGGHLIISALHVHVDEHHCMEVIAARGPARELKRMAEQLLSTRGVLSGDVVPAGLPPRKTEPL